MGQGSQACVIIFQKEFDQGSEIETISCRKLCKKCMNHLLITLTQLFKIRQINLIALIRFIGIGIYQVLRLTSCQAGAQVFQADGLEQALIHSRIETTLNFAGLCVRSKTKNLARGLSQLRLFGSYCLGQLIAIDDRHRAIRNYQVESPLPPRLEAQLAILCV